MQGMIGVRMESCGSASSPFVKDSSWHGPHTPWFVWVVIDQIMAGAKRLPPPSWWELSDDTHPQTQLPPVNCVVQWFWRNMPSKILTYLVTSLDKSIFLTSMTTIWLPWTSVDHAGHTTQSVQSRKLTTRTSSLMAIVEFPMLRAHSIYTRPRTSPPFFLFSFSPLHTTHSSKPEKICQNLRNSQSHLSMKISTTKKKNENRTVVRWLVALGRWHQVARFDPTKIETIDAA